MRLLATITIQPHLDKRHKAIPEKILPFPWDTQKKSSKKSELTPEQQRERMAELVKRLGDEI